MIKKRTFKISFFLLVYFSVKSVNGQQLHHQMLSAQGSSTTLKSGMMVRQTIGQQSITGNATVSNLTIQQGFQQSLVSNFSSIHNINTIVTTAYPNPFSGLINIDFSKSIAGEMNITLYNLFGVIVYREKKKDPALTFSLNFGPLPAGSYILRLTADKYIYSKILIKQ